MIEGLERYATAQFEEICRLRGVVGGLNGLEGLVEGGRRRRDASLAHSEGVHAHGNGNGNGEGVDGGVAGQIDGQDNRPTPPHLLPPQHVLTAHLAPVLAAQQSQLNARLQTTQGANARLWEGIQSQRQEIELLVKGLEKEVQDLETTGRLLESRGEGVREVLLGS